MIRDLLTTALDTVAFVAAVYSVWALVTVYQAGTFAGMLP